MLQPSCLLLDSRAPEGLTGSCCTARMHAALHQTCKNITSRLLVHEAWAETVGGDSRENLKYSAWISAETGTFLGQAAALKFRACCVELVRPVPVEPEGKRIWPRKHVRAEETREELEVKRRTQLWKLKPWGCLIKPGNLKKA